MDAIDELWARTAIRVHAARGWALHPVARLGRPRADRSTWLVQGDAGPVVVKVHANRSLPDRAAWAAKTLGVLRARRYPVPELLWWGALDQRWFVVVQTWLPGEAPDMLDDPTLDALLNLVERQHDPDLAPGGWDVSWWLAAVLFDGWERWWDRSLEAAPETVMRLRSFLEPVWGHRLPVEDVVHGDLNLSNVLVRGGAITGVVDWDAVGIGSRAVDLGSLLLGWQRLRLAGRAAPEGGARLVDRIVEISGDAGLRCVIAYGAVARLALTAQRGEAGELEAWRQTTDALLDLLA